MCAWVMMVSYFYRNHYYLCFTFGVSGDFMKTFFISICFLLFACSLWAQEEKQASAWIMFYNVENLFDPVDDPSTQDEEFTPAGSNHWTWAKFQVKRDGIAKTIIAAGAGEAPLLVGLCEVENRLVLNQLVQNTPLAKLDYGIVHRESPDLRGIDVALLYRKDYFSILSQQFYKVYLEANNAHTREILYAKGVWNGLDTLHVFVNHWPSKVGGAKESEPKRMQAAATLRAVIDSIFTTNQRANIVAMGDFNDTPDSRPVNEGLRSRALADGLCDTCLFNLLRPLSDKGEGSLKYRNAWELIDLFFLSGNLLNTKQPIYVDPTEAGIFRAPFLLERDERYMGDKPKRTLIGPRYNGGVSDHLPILMKVRTSIL